MSIAVSVDLPVPSNFKVINFTNTSVSIAWTYPIQRYSVPIQNFQVSYSSYKHESLHYLFVGFL